MTASADTAIATKILRPPENAADTAILDAVDEAPGLGTGSGAEDSPTVAGHTQVTPASPSRLIDSYAQEPEEGGHEASTAAFAVGQSASSACAGSPDVDVPDSAAETGAALSLPIWMMMTTRLTATPSPRCPMSLNHQLK